jgi:hypothetical protein
MYMNIGANNGSEKQSYTNKEHVHVIYLTD